MRLAFPGNWDVSINQVKRLSKLSDSGIQDALANPHDVGRLKNLGKHISKIVVAIEDITRPAKLERVLNTLFSELGIGDRDLEKVLFVVCNGAHAPMQREDLIQKVGKRFVENCLFANHNPYENLCDTGILYGNSTIKINRFYLEADLKIGIGSILPHSFAGFSSGAKLVVPGLADIKSITYGHKSVMLGLQGGIGDIDQNRFRQGIEEAVLDIGMDFYIGIVTNSHRETAAVFAGHPIRAHRAGVVFARQAYATRIDHLVDVIILNAYPNDGALFQVETALIPLKSSKRPLLTERGVVVLLSKCTRGLGYHSLFGYGMPLYRRPLVNRSLKGRDLVLFSPHTNRKEFHTAFHETSYLINDWMGVISFIERRFRKKCHVSILPMAPQQIIE